MISYSNGGNGAAQLWKKVIPGDVEINASTIGEPLTFLSANCVDGTAGANYELNAGNPSINIQTSITANSDSVISMTNGELILQSSDYVTNQNNQIFQKPNYAQIRTENNTSSDYNSLTIYENSSSLLAQDGTTGNTREVALDNTAGIGMLINNNLALGINPTGNLIIGNLDAPAVLTIQKKLIKVYDTGGLFVGYIEVKQ
jgi:hypothetical protein